MSREKNETLASLKSLVDRLLLKRFKRHATNVPASPEGRLLMAIVGQAIVDRHEPKFYSAIERVTNSQAKRMRLAGAPGLFMPNMDSVDVIENIRPSQPFLDEFWPHWKKDEAAILAALDGRIRAAQERERLAKLEKKRSVKDLAYES